MAGILDGVDKRTQLVGQNRLELLLFRLAGRQKFGINVFKVQEVIHCPTLTHLPKSHPAIRGVTTIRGRTIPVIDLAMSINMGGPTDTQGAYIIVTEYNRAIQGLLVHGMDRIVNMTWENIHAPPQGAGAMSYVTAVTRIDDELVEILDVEKIFAEVVRLSTDVSRYIVDSGHALGTSRHVLVVDDSSVARAQIKRTLDQIGIPCTVVNNGVEGFKILKKWVAEADERLAQLALVISDIEMPEMDGYTLTSEIRRDPALAHLYVILHTSLSGGFNNAMVEKVGANRFIAKFDADELATAVMERITGLAQSMKAA